MENAPITFYPESTNREIDIVELVYLAAFCIILYDGYTAIYSLKYMAASIMAQLELDASLPIAPRSTQEFRVVHSTSSSYPRLPRDLG